MADVDATDSAAESGSDEKDDSAVDTSHGCAPRFVQTIVLSSTFQYLVGTVIFLNVVAMCVQADYPVKELPPDKEDLWVYLNAAFLLFFLMELSLKMWVLGIKEFFCDPKEKGWNIFDFFIVATGVFDYAGKLMLCVSEANSEVSLVIRTLRILRVLRIVKLMKQFKKLKILARGLMESVSYIFWVAALIVGFIFVCAIVTTQVIGQEADQWGNDADTVRMYFGSTLQSMFTLFQFMTLDDWNSVFVMITDVMPMTTGPLIFYVVMSAFILLSLLTGSMVEHMQQVSQQEEEDEIKQLNETGEDEIGRKFRTVFNKSDSNWDHKIDKNEFGKVFDEPQLARELAADDIQLSGEEAIELFTLFDKDGDGYLSVREFKSGLEDYRKGLTMKQVLQLKRCMLYMTRSIQDGGSVPDSWLGGAKRATADAEQDLVKSEESVIALETRLMDFGSKIDELGDMVRRQFGDQDSATEEEEEDEA